MTRTCTICAHPKRPEIDLALAKGVHIAKVAKDFAVSYNALYRHRVNSHVIKALIEAKQGAVEIEHPDDLVGQLKSLQMTTLGVLRDARDSGDGRLALTAVSVAAKNIELMARLEGELIERIQQDERRLVIMKVVRSGSGAVDDVAKPVFSEISEAK